MDNHALRVLDFEGFLSRLAGFAQSEPGQAKCASLAPVAGPSRVREALALTGEAMKVVESGGLRLGGLTDIADILERLSVEGAVLFPEELRALAGNQAVVRAAKALVKESGADLPGIASLLGSLTVYGRWEKWVDGAISEKGEVLDSASPGLREARRELRSAREGVLEKLKGFVSRAGVAKVLRDDFFTVRNDRFVIPARPEYHRAFEGVVQDSSQSGQTLFVEPLFAVELNNRIIKAMAREDEEVRRVLREMSLQAREYREGFRVNLETLTDLDVLMAKGRIGVELDGVIPDLDAEGTELIDARHPLLVLRDEGGCVPIDIAVGGDCTTLVITGPNTGGKTVALKTLGLLTLMTQSGVPIPAAEGSTVRVFTQIFADIGDEQSLSQNLSTFSAHMAIVSEILDRADDETLVLLDELGAGTDPQEGSALGMALLETLHKAGACAVATTHHNLLKEFAYRAPYARNASAVFNADTLEPTFRIRLGLPGRSHALEIAERLGVGPEVVFRAREIMGKGAVGVEDLLGRLSEEVEREEKARIDAERLSSQLEMERERIRVRQEKAREEVGRLKETARREASAVIEEVRRKGKDLLREIRGSSVPQARLQEELAEMESEVVSRLPRTGSKRRSKKPVAVGQRVEILTLGIEGEVVTLAAEGREAVVQAGDIRLKVAASQLDPVDQTGEDSGTGKVPVPGGYAYDGHSGSSHEVNLLGCTVEDALRSVDRVLDRSLLGPDRRLRLVHGKGSGALRRAIARALEDDPRVRTFAEAPLEEGGAGVTVVELKD